jgi:hypothetical protein
MIFRCGDVGEVFPRRQTPRRYRPLRWRQQADPYDAATEARDCGGMGVIAAIKERVTIADCWG